MPAENMPPMAKISGESFVGIWKRFSTNADETSPAKRPSSPPSTLSTIASLRNCSWTSDSLAPTASRSHLSRALSDGHQHDIHDADATHEQGQRRNASQTYGQNPAGRQLSLYYVLRAADVEVVSFRWIEMVALTRQSHNLLCGLRHGFAGDSRAEDVEIGRAS